MSDTVSFKLNWWVLGIVSFFSLLALDMFLGIGIPKVAIAVIGFLGPYVLIKLYDFVVKKNNPSQFMMNRPIPPPPAATLTPEEQATLNLMRTRKAFEKAQRDLEEASKPQAAAPVNDALGSFNDKVAQQLKAFSSGAEVAQDRMMNSTTSVPSPSSTVVCRRTVVGELFCPCNDCSAYRVSRGLTK